MRRLLLASAALACLAAAPASAGTVRLCGGDAPKGNAPPGIYVQAADIIAGFAPQGTTILPVRDTGGTWGNVRRTVRLDSSDPAACDAMLGSPDGKALLAKENPTLAGKLRRVGTLHREYAHVLCSAKSGVEELDDIEGDKTKSVALGADGSGSWLLWQNWVAEDEGYEAIQTRREGGTEALSAVASGDITCFVRAAGLGDGTVKDADRMFPGELRLVDADDSDFNDARDADGGRLYEFSTIPGGTYPESLQTGWGSGVDTVSWLAAVYANTDRVKGQDYDALVRAVAEGRKQVRAQFGE